jgi:hypothetical protein
MNGYKVIDDFLPIDVFENIRNEILPGFPGTDENKRRFSWCYEPSAIRLEKESENKNENWRLIFFADMIYERTILSPDIFFKLVPHFDESIGVRQFIRIKVNLYPNTETIEEHGMHIDFPFEHKGALFYLNTNNGYTKLEDGTKIESIENRLLLFDPNKLHTSSTCTDQPVRVNINFNYF